MSRGWGVFAPESVVLELLEQSSICLIPPRTHRRTGVVTVKRDNDRTFEVAYFKAPQAATQASKATVSFSPDGQHLTVTTKGSGDANDDVRVYDRINADNWPTVKP